jgi:hypothetical protein
MAPLTAQRPRPEAVLSHSASRLVNLDELAVIPAGAPMGPHHRPVPHIELVSTVKQAFSDRGYAVAREQYSVSHENARLFGTLDLMPTTGAPLVEGLEGGMAVGLRHANDQAFALGVIAGLRVFVCDNMAFSGGDRLLRRKHTTGLELVAEVDRGLDRTFHSFRDLVQLVDQLRDTKLTDAEAKVLLYDLALDGRVIAPDQLGKVHGWYFTPEEMASAEDRERGLSDVLPRNAWAVANAVTRVARSWTAARQQETGVALSGYLVRYFRMHAPESPTPN